MGEEAIERQFKAGDVQYIDAVLMLQSLGHLPEDAEDMVTEWEAEASDDIKNVDSK